MALSQLEVSTPRAASTLGLGGCRPADEPDAALAGADELETHLGQPGESPARRDVLEGEVGVHHLGRDEVLSHDGLDRRRQHAERDVTRNLSSPMRHAVMPMR